MALKKTNLERWYGYEWGTSGFIVAIDRAHSWQPFKISKDIYRWNRVYMWL